MVRTTFQIIRNHSQNT
jgi:hypothetical protein